ncbi:hypothetical protein EG329_000043 [Mollisiaceae sp. DMI_Dod_QoI]|nr:hypothetical protein EG329_000043 [Helotiales sp. DMI_Dod_QoI]
MAPVQLKYMEDSGPKDFIDASIVGYSNPSREALSEGKSISNGRHIKCLINLGTGDRAHTTNPEELGSWFPTAAHLALIRLLYNISTDPLKVAHELERDGLEGRFYGRFSVESGLYTVHSMDFSETARKTIISQTEGYLTRDIRGRIRGWSVELQDNLDLLSNETFLQRETNSLSLSLFGMGNERPELRGNDEIATRGWFNSFENFVRPLFSQECEDEDTRKIKVAVLDTGIDANHPFMSVVSHGQKRLKYCQYKDFTKDTLDKQGPIDACGHGTHIAGIILEMAPYVELYIARVFESQVLGAEEALSVAKAIKWATDEWHVDIISMSFGFEAQQEDLVEVVKSIEAAYDKNIVMLAAVSNDGNRPLDPIAFPARHPYVICINSADGDGNKSSFNPPAPNGKGKTRRADNFSILGQGIRSCWPEKVETEGIRRTEEHGTFKECSGSSSATAVAASVAALIMELGEKKRGLIAKHRKLKTYRGIQQVFTLMAGEDEIEDFKNIRPWRVFHSSEEAAAHLIDKEVKNP